MALDGVFSKPSHGQSRGRFAKAYRRSKETTADGAGGKADANLVGDAAAREKLSEAHDSTRTAPGAQLAGLPRRHVPNSSIVLALLDFIFLAVTQTAVLGDIYLRLEFADRSHAVAVIVLSVLVSMIFLYATGCYRRDSLVNSVIAASRLPVALGFGGVVLFFALHFGLGALYPNDVLYLSISRCATVVLIITGVSLCAAMVSRGVFYAMARRHWFQRRVLVIGTGQRALHLHELMSQAPHKLATDLLFAPETTIGGRAGNERGALQNAIIAVETESIGVIARDLLADEIVFAPDERRGLSLDCLLDCKTSGIPVTDYNAFIERETGRIDLNNLDVSWLIYSDGFRIRLIDTVLKRLLDVAVSVAFLLLSLPVLLLAIAAIASEGRGPIFYPQKRVTRNGRSFWLYKLRTMRPNAESRGPQWAAENDPRITRVGRLLRRWRIDEIPQLVNVVRGDMSLVGPRPERPCFVKDLSQEIRMYNLRHAVRAGITGWAQINYRYGASVVDAKRKLEYDLYYIKNYSLLRDLSILLQTLRVVVWPQGVR